MSLNTSKLAEDMLNAFKQVLSEKWPEIEVYAESETKNLAESLAKIEKLKLAGKINEEQAKLQLGIQKNAAQTVLLTIEGLEELAVEQALNATFKAVKDAVNAAVGFVLL